MIPLKIQAGAIFLSFFMGFLSFLIYDFFNRLFYKFQGKLIRLPFEICLFTSLSLGYYFFLCSICRGKYNVFYFLFFFIGGVAYYKFYRVHFLRKYEDIMVFIKKKIYFPLVRKKRKFLAKIKIKFIKKKKIKKKITKSNKKAKKKNA